MIGVQQSSAHELFCTCNENSGRLFSLEFLFILMNEKQDPDNEDKTFLLKKMKFLKTVSKLTISWQLYQKIVLSKNK